MRHRLFGVILFLGAALAACGGSQTVGYTPSTTPTSGTSSSTVSFLVVVPSATTSARQRPNVVVPSNATSVTFTLDSVGGTPYSGTPTTETLASSNGACTSVNGQLSCDFNVTAPVGALVYTVTVYDGTSVIAEGNVAVTTTAGGTVSAPFTLSGTVAKIALSVGTGITGLAASYPITVQAEDSKGNTILGTYTSAITLSDSDTSGVTSITTSGSDNPPAHELLSSSDTAALNYNGAALSSAATIGASASGVSASNITTASFLPTASVVNTSGTLTFGVTYYASDHAYDATATPSANPTSTSFPVTVATGATLGSATNLVSVTGLSTSPNGAIPLSTSAATYYAWSAGSGGTAMGLAGYSDPQNAYVPYFTQLDVTEPDIVSLIETCASPDPQLVLLPLASWNVYGGSGTCTTTFTDTAGDTDVYAYAANGSYTDTNTLVATGSDWDFYIGMSGTQTVSVDASGNLTYSIDAVDSGAAGGPAGEVYGSGTLAVTAPSAGASTVQVNWTLQGTDFGPIIPTPAPTSVPNPWLAVGAPNGTVPNPLFSDTVVSKGSVTSLPSQCAVTTTLLGSSPSLSETEESIVAADPMDTWLPFYNTTTIYHYYLNGINEVCNEAVSNVDYFDAWGYGNNYEGSDGPPIWSFGTIVSGALAYYSGIDQNWDSDYDDTYTYLTASSVLAALARTRDMSEALPLASRALESATYAGLRARLMRPRVAKHQAAKPSTYVWPRR